MEKGRGRRGGCNVLTTARNGGGSGSKRRASRGRRWLSGAGSLAFKDESRAEERVKWGRERAARARGSSKRPEARVEEGDHGGAVGLAVPESGEREGAGAGAVEEMMLTGGPDLSAGERGEGGRNWPAGPGPRRERGARGFGPKGREKERGKGFAIFLFQINFQYIF